MGEEMINEICYWGGTPISELPREVLEEEFIIAQRRIILLENSLTDRSIENVNLMAENCRLKVFGRA